jgi:hypothetical protein
MSAYGRIQNIMRRSSGRFIAQKKAPRGHQGASTGGVRGKLLTSCATVNTIVNSRQPVYCPEGQSCGARNRRTCLDFLVLVSQDSFCLADSILAYQAVAQAVQSWESPFQPDQR